MRIVLDTNGSLVTRIQQQKSSGKSTKTSCPAKTNGKTPGGLISD
jgi:hypothetical protein